MNGNGRVTMIVPVTKDWTKLVKESQFGNPSPSLDEKIKVLDVLLHSSISTATGAALGLLDNELKNGLDYHGVPIDGTMGALSQVLAYLTNSSAALSAGDSCFGVYGFRQSKKLIGALRVRVAQAAQSKMHGEESHVREKEPPATVDTDPITSKYKDFG